MYKLYYLGGYGHSEEAERLLKEKTYALKKLMFQAKIF